LGGLRGGLQTASHPRKELINLGTKKGQRRKTARRAYSGWEVTGNKIGRKTRHPIRSFRTKSEANRFIKKQLKTPGYPTRGSNLRVRRVR